MGTLKIVGVFAISVALLSAILFIVSNLREGGNGGGDQGAGKLTGALPTWSSGNQWSYENQTGTTFSYSVSGEETYSGVLCYRLDGTINPSFEGWGSKVQCRYEKENLGLYMEVISDSTKSQSTQYTRSYSTGPWPLEVGGTYTESVDAERYYVDGVEGSQETLPSQTFSVTVENIENITISVGTFECFKIVKRNPVGQLVENRWYSSTAKNFVKIANHQTGETLELSSYQV